MAWVGGNFYLNTAQQQENAVYIRDYLLPLGWTINSICGMLGNMQTESTINPSIWQNLDEGNLDLGFGLVQWTPSRNYIDWCTEEGLIYTEMDTNLTRIEYECNNNLQWIKTSSYPLTFYQFKVSNLDPYTLAMMFLRNYERPANPNQPIRGTQAQNWYEYLTGNTPNPPIPPNPSRVQNKMPVYYYLRRI